MMVLTGVIPDEVLLIHAMMVADTGFLVETERNLRHPRRKPTGSVGERIEIEICSTHLPVDLLHSFATAQLFHVLGVHCREHTPVKPEQKVTIKVTIDVSRKVSKSEQKGAKK